MARAQAWQQHVEAWQVSAFVVYQTDTMNAKVLAQPPK